MIDFRLDLAVPDFFEFKPKHLFLRGDPIRWWPNKAWEVQLTQFNPSQILSLRFHASLRGRDHAGIEAAIQLFGLYVGVEVYDVRHWSDDEGCWETPEETRDRG